MAIDREPLRVAVVGCGLIGGRRAHCAATHGQSRLARAIDVSDDAARRIAERYGATASNDWHDAVRDPAIDAVVVSTPNALLAPVAIAALESGKHVLVEKPMGCDLTQARHIAAAAGASRGSLKVGFNHRYHPALQRAHQLFAEGAVGRAINVRARYGHGGRPGYEREWRANRTLSGGGELLDQGVHVADLLNWFLGLPCDAFAYLQTAVWPIAPLEDNAFGLLRYANGCIASLHTSWTQWKNLFSFELFGVDGSLTIRGLGGSYGEEELTIARRKPEGGVPAIERERFAGPDRSWELEWEDFVSAILDGSPYWGTPEDGLAAMRVIEALYASARSGTRAFVQAQGDAEIEGVER